MTSPEKRRQIQDWAQTVAACANGIDELKVNEAPATEPSETTATSYDTSIQRDAPKPRKDQHVVRVVVHPSSSDGSIQSRDRSRRLRSSRPVVINDTSGSTSRSRPAYAASQESYVPKQKSPPRPSRNRTPPGTYPKYNIVRRISTFSRPAPPEPETSSRPYVNERPSYYKEDQLRVPSKPSKPSRPRPHSMDSRNIYYPRPHSPRTQRAAVRSPSPPRRITYVRAYDNLPRRTVSLRGGGDARMTKRWEDDDRPNSEQPLNQLYDDVDKLRDIDARRVYPLGDSGRRRRSFGYRSYDDYGYDCYDHRRRAS